MRIVQCGHSPFLVVFLFCGLYFGAITFFTHFPQTVSLPGWLQWIAEIISWSLTVISLITTILLLFAIPLLKIYELAMRKSSHAESFANPTSEGGWSRAEGIDEATASTDDGPLPPALFPKLCVTLLLASAVAFWGTVINRPPHSPFISGAGQAMTLILSSFLLALTVVFVCCMVILCSAGCLVAFWNCVRKCRKSDEETGTLEHNSGAISLVFMRRARSTSPKSVTPGGHLGGEQSHQLPNINRSEDASLG